jgi:hypothetical protein
LAQRVERIRAREDFGGVVLGILGRLIAEARGCAVVPPATRVRRHAPDGQEADVFRLDAAVEEVQQIAMAEPGAQVTLLGRTFEATADAHAHTFDAVLVPVHSRERFAPYLAQTVEAVRAQFAVETEALGDRIHADRVIRAREYDALHAVPARALVDLDQPAQVVFDDLGQRALHAGSGEMDQHVHAFEQAIDDSRIAQVAMHHVLAFDERRQGLRSRCRTQRRAARDHGGTDDRAQLTAGATQGNLLHKVPLHRLAALAETVVVR